MKKNHFDAISEAISELSPDWDLINSCITEDFYLDWDNEKGVKEFYKAAHALIEPTMPDDLAEWYGEFCNSEGWAGSLIANIECFAAHDPKNWIKVIKTIQNNGY